MFLPLDMKKGGFVEGLDSVTVLVELDGVYKGYNGVLLEDKKNAIIIDRDENCPERNFLVMMGVSPISLKDHYIVTGGYVELGRSKKEFNDFAVWRLIQNLKKLNGLELLSIINDCAVTGHELDITDVLAR